MSPIAMPLVTVKRRHQVTLPAKLRGELPVEEGDVLEIVIRDGAFVLTPKKVTDRAHPPAVTPKSRSHTERMKRMDAVVDRFRAIPQLDPRDVDAILYDDNGLPQ